MRYKPRLELALVLFVIVVCLLANSYAGRSELRTRQYEGCLVGSANRVDDARALASDSVRERRLSYVDEPSTTRAAHRESADASEAISRSLLDRAGIPAPTHIEAVVLISPYSPQTRSYRMAFCAHTYPAPGLLGF